MSAIEALYIFDEHNSLILEHIYDGRPPAPSVVLPLYLKYTVPRPSVVYLSSLHPSAVLFTLIHDGLLFMVPSSSDKDPLLVLEFLHRVTDAFEEFLGAPLLSSKITSNYDVVTQIVSEMVDGGVICQGEANVLRDVVETGPGVLKNLLGNVGLPGGASPGLTGGPGGFQRPTIQPPQSAQGSAVPWRRSNVRHTSNELYVDIVESLSVILAPSGRPLSAFAYGNIAFTSKVSGVPDLILSLSTDGKGAGMGSKGDQLRSVMERAVFHPCVRLNRWKADGVMSFIPPDGRFALCGYEADLLGPDAPLTISQSKTRSLDIPATITMSTCLGGDGSEFEVRVVQPSSGSFGVRSAAAASLQSNLGRPTALRATPSGDSKAPSLEDVVVRINLPSSVRNVPEIRPSRGEAQWLQSESCLEWKISSKDGSVGGAVLRCAVLGNETDSHEHTTSFHSDHARALTYDYDEDGPSAYQTQESQPHVSEKDHTKIHERKQEQNRGLMPSSVAISFTVKGWLASGIKVESLAIDSQKSKGLGVELKPYKGVKYVTVSRNGIETRC